MRTKIELSVLQDFDVLLTVQLSIISVINQRNT